MSLTNPAPELTFANDYFFFSFFLTFIFEREREQAGEGAEREGDRGSEAGSSMIVESPMRGSEPKSDA